MKFTRNACAFATVAALTASMFTSCQQTPSVRVSPISSRAEGEPATSPSQNFYLVNEAIAVSYSGYFAESESVDLPQRLKPSPRHSPSGSARLNP
jgi:hypothetical protein